MTIDGKENVKKRIEIFNGPNFITYKYVFENENYYNDTVPKWERKDHSPYVNKDEGHHKF